MLALNTNNKKVLYNIYLNVKRKYILYKFSLCFYNIILLVLHVQSLKIYITNICQKITCLNKVR